MYVMRIFHVNFAGFGSVSPARSVELPDLWLWRDIRALPMLLQFDGDVAVDAARWRGFLSLVNIYPVDGIVPGGSVRAMLSRCPVADWLSDRLANHLPPGFPVFAVSPVVGSQGMWQSIVCRCVWHSVHSANLLNYSDIVYDWFIMYREFAVAEAEQAWLVAHFPAVVTDVMRDAWRNEFTLQVNAAQPPAFRWLAAVLVDIRCYHRVWKDVGAVLPPYDARLVFYDDAWTRRSWGEFVN